MSSFLNVRILALWRDDRSECPLTFDALIDASTRRVASSWEIFGACDLYGESCRPFVLRRDGRIDFGAAGTESWRTDFREAVVEIGGRFTIHWNELDFGVYEIVKVAEPGVKEFRE